MVFFSSPELKDQVSFSDHPLSVRLSVHFYIFNVFSRKTEPILIRLGTDQSWEEGIQVVQMKGNVLLQWQIKAKELKYTDFLGISPSPEPAGQVQSHLVQVILG
jgi:hypothetical protein